MKKIFCSLITALAISAASAQPSGSSASVLSQPGGVNLQRIEGQGNGGWVLDLTKESVDSIFSNPSHRVLLPVYQALKGPVRVEIIDSALVPKGVFAIQFSDTTPKSTWKLYQYNNSGLSTDTVYSNATINVGNYQIIPNLGLAIQAVYVLGAPSDSNGGFLEGTMEFSNPVKDWLTSVADVESPGNDDWIRSGINLYSNPALSDFNDYVGVDDKGYYEKVIGGTWAPYRLCAYSDPSSSHNSYCTAGPAWEKSISLNKEKYTLASVDVVITSDKSRWTRCPVIELQEDTNLAEGAARKMDLRSSPSVDQNGIKGDGLTVSSNHGDPGYLAATGMGWFPGYAINLETGERLNMAFGEDSGLPTENGRDMVWNPTENQWGSLNAPLFGGKHYIYIFNHVGDQKLSALDKLLANGLQDLPRYDGGLAMWQLLNTVTGTLKNDYYKRLVYADAMWVNLPLLNPNHTLLESDAKIRLRVTQKYRKGYSGKIGLSYLPSVVDTAANPVNNNNPLYNFDTGKIANGVIEFGSPVGLNIYPNPFDQQATFTFENMSAIQQLSIYDITGKRVRNYESIGEKQFTIQRENLKTGIYFYHVISEHGKTRIGKLVIN